MSTTAKNPDSTRIPVQLSDTEFHTFIFPAPLDAQARAET